MKKYVLNVKTSRLHKNTCFHIRNLEEIKRQEFHTIDEAKKSCKDIKFCKTCKVMED